MQENSERVPVVVTTAHRGVFFGYIEPGRIGDEVVTITNARMCVYWERAVGGVVGLADGGPTDGCRISGRSPEATLRAVIGFFRCSEKAAKAWESAPCLR